MNQEENENLGRPSILDAVSLSQQNAALRTFNPQSLVLEHLEKLTVREKQILTGRYGLASGSPLTLEEIGKKLNLTRERVRQIEKDTLKKLNELSASASFVDGINLLFQIIEENGNIIKENRIFDIILASSDTPVNRMGILFLLYLIPRFHLLKESALYHRAWHVAAFDQKLLEQTMNLALSILNEAGKPLARADLFKSLRAQAEKGADFKGLSDDGMESYLFIFKKVERNPFNEWGLSSWPEIRPKDVGDKAYLVLLHDKSPQHYGKITEMINKYKFDERIAQKETVHNELIKDKRFVLVGRGIYALSSWGYKPGVVADIIEDLLRKAQQPLSRDELIGQVLKQRLVKKNTIIVGLSNRTRFKKTPENKYILADHV